MGEKGRSEIEGDKDETKWDRLAWDNEGDGSSGRCRRRREKRERRKERKNMEEVGGDGVVFIQKNGQGADTHFGKEKGQRGTGHCSKTTTIDVLSKTESPGQWGTGVSLYSARRASRMREKWSSNGSSEYFSLDTELDWGT